MKSNFFLLFSGLQLSWKTRATADDFKTYIFISCENYYSVNKLGAPVCSLIVLLASLDFYMLPHLSQYYPQSRH